MASASFSGKFQIDGGQSLALSNQVPLGWSASLVFTLPAGTPAVPAGPGGKPPATTANPSTQTAKVLNGPVTAQMVAIHADAYPDKAAYETLTLKLEGTGNAAELSLSGDLLIANSDLLNLICPGWNSITVTSTIQKQVNVQVLVVWNPS